MRECLRLSHTWMVANVNDINGVGFGFEKHITFSRLLRVSRHPHACIVANVKVVKSKYWVSKQNYGQARASAPLSRMDRGKCALFT